MQLKVATRKQVKLRMGLSAVSGGGKTYSALLLAFGITNDWGKIAVIDTENGSGSLYSHLGKYNVIELKAPFSPERYTEALHACEKAGMEVIIVDSITPEWESEGGCLYLVEKAGGRYQDWAKVTPRHNAFINAMLQSSAHIITTVRRKQDYEMTKDQNGKIKIEKAGLKEITRESFEYELTLNLNIDITHQATASKDRTELFTDKPPFIITPDTGKMIKEWCESGEAVAPEITVAEAIERLAMCNSTEELSLLKSTLPASVTSNKEFQNAGLARFKVINPPAPKTETAQPALA